MDWEAIGAMGQMLGSFAVLVTLIYVAVQLRLARDEVRRAASRARVESLREMIVATRLTNAPLNALNAKLSRALGAEPRPFVTELVKQAGVTEEEAELAYWEQQAWWQNQVHVFLMRNQLTEGEWKSFEANSLRVYSGRSAGALFYRTMRSTLNPDVVAYVDALLAERGSRA